MIRQFVGLTKAAEMLNSDSEGLIQALELGLGETLPVYIYLKGWGFPAEFTGRGVKAKYEWNGGPSCTVKIPDFGEFTDDGYGIEWLKDPFCTVVSSYEDTSRAAFEYILTVQGYIRVLPSDVLDCVRSRDVPATLVAPSSWWATTSPVPKGAGGNPRVLLALRPAPDTGYEHLSTVSDFLFRIEDIEALKASRERAQASSARAQLDGIEDHIDPRTEATLLVIIGALASQAGLDLAQPHTAAKQVSSWLDEDVVISEHTIARHLTKVRKATNSRRR